ncbi:hypothetical protein [Mammaliicoccus sciuri]|uniref:hypothetical protein n=1 Tax=Mammaliicoccus sciuri TaxID=1296 RepID=UPI0019502FFB|nr:hypothetical protein [Mammaliicoccus sciuri]MCD8896561.1 hypothetical protein [Mammaliicoccus sciuri]
MSPNDVIKIDHKRKIIVYKPGIELEESVLLENLRSLKATYGKEYKTLALKPGTVLIERGI